MRRVMPDRPWPLFDAAATRAIEQRAAAALPAHTLMQRAGLAVARLALALAPHGRTYWIACGPGNNGGDGLEAAMHLRQWGKEPIVTWLGDEARAPADAAASLGRARDAGVQFASKPASGWDLAVDGLLGIGSARPLDGAMAAHVQAINAAGAPVLAIDLPSGLDADTGQGQSVHADHTLSLLTLKPGLFTGRGRDAAGQVWFDDLGVRTEQAGEAAMLAGPPPAAQRPHASHKGSYGDVAVIGGAPGMAGAALLAATAALHAGAGRVYVRLLDEAAPSMDTSQAALMFRTWDALDLSGMAVAAGCGGGDAIRAVLARIVATSHALVLDADALNAIAADTQLQLLVGARSRRARPTVLTPHPLEAARLLETTVAQVQADRLGAARELARRFGAVAVLKGSGTVVAAPDRLPWINPTGNARLATAGTGDVLAGMIAARLASGIDAVHAAAGAVYAHGLVADRWREGRTLTARLLAQALECGSSPQ